MKSTVKRSDSEQIAGSVDTNILLRYALHDVPDQSRAIEVMLASGASPVVEDAAILEMMYALEKVYEMKRDAVCDNVCAVIRSDAFVCNSAFFERVLLLYENEDKLSIIDCALLEYARQRPALPLKTFDKDMIKRSHGDASSPGV